MPFFRQKLGHLRRPIAVEYQMFASGDREKKAATITPLPHESPEDVAVTVARSASRRKATVDE